jgi:hypothetical protein
MSLQQNALKTPSLLDADGSRGVSLEPLHKSAEVTLPKVSDFPGLTPCQQKKVQDAIDNILAPHEQQHVAAFGQYNGATSRPIDLDVCRPAFDSTIKTMFEAEEGPRKASAKAASAALDGPGGFHFDVDLTCDDASPNDSAGGSGNSSPNSSTGGPPTT